MRTTPTINRVYRSSSGSLDMTAEDLLRSEGTMVKVLVRILALHDHTSLQGDARKQTSRLRVGKDGCQISDGSYKRGLSCKLR